MNFVRTINRLISLFLDTLRQVGRGRIWLVLLFFFILNWLVLYAHYKALSPIFYGPIKLWAELIGAREATGFFHYPGHFLVLPLMFDWARMVVGLLFEGVALGVVALMFFDGFLEVKKPEASPFKLVWASWVQLILGWALLYGLMLALAIFLPSVLGSWMQGSPRRMLAFELGLLPALFTVLLALLYFVIPSIAIYGDNVWEALKRSLAVFRSNPGSCLVLAVAVLFGQVLVSFAAGRPVTIIEKFRPELVYWVLLIGLVVNALASFVWMGTAVRFLIEEE